MSSHLVDSIISITMEKPLSYSEEIKNKQKFDKYKLLNSLEIFIPLFVDALRNLNVTNFENLFLAKISVENIDVVNLNIQHNYDNVTVQILLNMIRTIYEFIKDCLDFGVEEYICDSVSQIISYHVKFVLIYIQCVITTI